MLVCGDFGDKVNAEYSLTDLSYWVMVGRLA